MKDRQRHTLSRALLEMETLLGEIRSLRRRDRSRLTAEDCRRLDLLIARKQVRLREMQTRAAKSGAGVSAD
jgi:hypothetical protein